MSGLVVTVQPTQEPLSLDEAKAHLRVDTGDDDALIGEFITAARCRVEAAAYVRLITQTLVLTLDGFPWGLTRQSYSGMWPLWGGLRFPAIELEPPVQSISSLVYVDPEGSPQTLSSGAYRLDAASIPCRVTPSLDNVWPATAPLTNSVSLTYVGGFGVPSAVPGNLIEACKLMLGHYYLNREQILSGNRLVALEIPEGLDDLVRAHKPPLVA